MSRAGSSSSRDLGPRLEEVRRAIIRSQWLRALCLFALGSLMVTGLTLGWLYVRGDRPRDWLIGASAFALLHVVMAAAVALQVRRETPTARQIALYVDEHHPELENLVLTAAEAEVDVGDAPAPWMVQRLLSDPRLATDRLSLGGLVAPGRGLKFAATAGVLGVIWLAVLVLGRSVWMPPFPVGAVFKGGAVLSLHVEPGNARVRRGQSQVIVARTAIAGPRATLHWRRRAGDWHAVEMQPGQNPKVQHHQLGSIESGVEYRVTWNGLESPEYDLRVWEPPAVESIDLTYHYPDYLDLPARSVPGGGNMAAVEGTVVDVEVAVNKALARASLVLESGEEIRLHPEGELSWRGQLRLTADDQYRVSLRDGDGETNPMARQYRILVKPDAPPVIRVRYPLGDADATLLEEVPFEFLVEDDFGIADYGIQYQVGGGEPVRLSLRGDDPALEALATHTLALEELDLHPGDLMTWSAWAEDRRPDRGDYEGAGDLYFLKIRPFAHRYREARSQADGMNGGAGGGDLAEIQKQVVIATWNLKARAARLPREEFDGDRRTILEMELEVLHQVEALIHASSSPEAEAQLRQLGAELTSAVKALEAARGEQAGAQLAVAERHEREAYELIASNAGGEMQVARSASMSPSMRRNTPADVDELELDRNRNFYEEERRPPSGADPANAALERLRELAARQALVSEEIARLISELERARSEAEREEIRRRLERLKEEIRQNLEQTDELERQLQSGALSPGELREAMNRLDEARRQNTASLESLTAAEDASEGEPTELQQARSASRRALDALQSLETELADRSRASVEDRLASFIKRYQAFMDDERALLGRMNELGGEGRAPGLRPTDDSDEHRAELQQKSREAADEFVGMMESAGDLAAEASTSQPLLSRKLGDWLRETSASGVAEDLDAAREALDYGLWEAAVTAQTGAHEKLAAAAGPLGELLDLLVDQEADAMRIALEHLNRLMEEAGLGSADGSGDSGRDIRESADAAPEDGQAGGRERPPEAAGDSRGGRTTQGGTDGAAPGEPGPGPNERDAEGAGTEAPDVHSRDDGNSFRIAWGEEETGGENAAADEAAEQGRTRGAEPSGRDSLRGREPDAEGRASMAQGASREGEAGMNAEEPGEAAAEARAIGTRASASPGEGSSLPRTGRGPAAAGNAGERPAPASRFSAVRSWPVDPRELLGEDFRPWMEQLRSAQAVLGEGDAVSERLDAIALQMEQLRREYRRTGLEPRFDLFLEGVAMPLEALAADLEQRLRQALRGEELPVFRAEEVPAPYQELVAEYFEALSGGAESAGE